MNEKALLITAIICILLGLPLLYFCSKYIIANDPRVLSEITGVVASVNSKEKITIVNVIPDRGIPVVFFGNQSFEKGEQITVQGQLKSYNNGLEFVAE